MNARHDFSSVENGDMPATVPVTDELALAGFARTIREAVTYAKKHARNAVLAARRVGQNLIDARQRVAHGEWETWVRQNTPLALRTAQAYMKLATRLDALPSAEA